VDFKLTEGRTDAAGKLSARLVRDTYTFDKREESQRQRPRFSLTPNSGQQMANWGLTRIPFGGRAGGLAYFGVENMADS